MPPPKKSSKGVLFLAAVFLVPLIAASLVLVNSLSIDWTAPVCVVLRPVNGDGSTAVKEYLAGLKESAFKPAADFIHSEALTFGVKASKPLSVVLGDEVRRTLPQSPPDLGIAEKFQWAFIMKALTPKIRGVSDDINVFLVFYDPKSGNTLDSPVTVGAVFISLIELYADGQQQDEHNIVLARELLRMAGATDKINPETGQPLFPDGYAEPGRKPLYPQRYAEIMGGSRPVSQRRSVTPASLDEIIVGYQTAVELKWVDLPDD